MSVAALIVTAALVGGCSSKPDVVVQGNRGQTPAELTIAWLWNQVAVANAQVGAAKRNLADLRQAIRDTEAELNTAPRVQQMLQQFGLTIDDLCIPSGPGKARASRERRRQQALATLNFSCPSPQVWRLGPSTPGQDPATERRLVKLLNQVAPAQAKIATASRNLAQRRRVATMAEALLKRTPHAQQVLKSFTFTLDNICTPITANSNREHRRQQALHTLHLTCPAP